ncbi:MAG: protein phosphatase 2C domain-containing protein [Deltaproteobacteria bacterium]|nr:protein phosphatase 2C domain-containing protein [Deltaproteobacteria bacterium]
MRAVAAGVTDVGRERDHNEDRFVLLPTAEVFVVADGMGGHQCGEVASQMATATIAGFFESSPALEGDGALGQRLRAALEEANCRIHQRAAASPAHRGMGTTVVAVAFHPVENRLYVAHAGDSRCYRFRARTLTKLTRDHSLLEEALRARPGITEEELSFLPTNVITRALGVDSSVDPDVASDASQAGDRYLLCSDGLHGFVGDERIREILDGQADIAEACSELIAEANRNGGGDNITAVLVRIEALGTAGGHAPLRPSIAPLLAVGGDIDVDVEDVTPASSVRFDVGTPTAPATDVDETEEPTPVPVRSFAFDIEDAPTAAGFPPSRRPPGAGDEWSDVFSRPSMPESTPAPSSLAAPHPPAVEAKLASGMLPPPPVALDADGPDSLPLPPPPTNDENQ